MSGSGGNLHSLRDLPGTYEKSGLSSRTIESLSSSFPALDEQRVIASVLTDMDLDIQALESRLDKTRQIKQGMMQELLTGNTRLI